MINTDLNYIVKLEKAIGEKFGQEATINPRSLWNEEKEKKFVDSLKESFKLEDKNLNTKEKIDYEGVLVSKNVFLNQQNKICEGCKKYSLDKKDDVYLLKFKACHKCYISYIEDRENRWLSGWRPTEK